MIHQTTTILSFVRKLFCQENLSYLFLAAPGSISLTRMLDVLLEETPIKALMLPLVVGTLLLYPDRTVQHAGVALDSGRVAAHIGVGLPWEELRSEFLTDRLYPAEAVTAACMASTSYAVPSSCSLIRISSSTAS
mgnify:CR=1 FL=1